MAQWRFRHHLRQLLSAAFLCRAGRSVAEQEKRNEQMIEAYSVTFTGKGVMEVELQRLLLEADTKQVLVLIFEVSLLLSGTFAAGVFWSVASCDMWK